MSKINFHTVLLLAAFWLIYINFSCKKDSDKEQIIHAIPPLTDLIPYEKLSHGKLVFQRVGTEDNAYSGIYVIDIDLQRSWGIGGKDFDGPAISPDGQKIAYATTALTETAYDVYILNTDGTNAQCIESINGQENNPRWTPDGKKILYHAFHFDSDVEGLYRQSPVPNPADRELVVDFRRLVPPFDFYNQLGAFSVSQNGAIAITYRGIYILDSNGSEFTKIISETENHPLYSAAWSPSGDKLALLAMIIDQGDIQSLDVILLNQDGTNPDTLTTMTASGNTTWWGSNSYSLCWSPDGLQIAFTRPDGQDLGSHIYIIRIDGTGLTQVTSAPGVADRSLSWSN